MCIRPDTFGVFSILRTFGLRKPSYDRLLDFFHSPAPAPALSTLTVQWVKAVLGRFPGVMTVNGRLLIVGDGLKVPKSGKKMPAVKRLHQSSDCSTTPPYIRGHSCQVVAVLVGALSSVLAVPRAGRIHEGLVFSPRDARTLLDKMMLLSEKGHGLPPGQGQSPRVPSENHRRRLRAGSSSTGTDKEGTAKTLWSNDPSQNSLRLPRNNADG